MPGPGVLSRLPLLAAALLLLFLEAAVAEMPQGMRKFLGENRLLLVFAPSISHPSYTAQTRTLLLSASGVAERELLIVEVTGIEPVRVEALSDEEMDPRQLREFYDVEEEEFRVILIGKDGEAKLEAGEAVGAEELFATIDALPAAEQKPPLGG